MDCFLLRRHQLYELNFRLQSKNLLTTSIVEWTKLTWSTIPNSVITAIGLSILGPNLNLKQNARNFFKKIQMLCVFQN